VAHVAPQALAQGRALLDLLPEPSELGAWSKDGEPQFFEGEDLYIYIDGGAEIYQEYGFLRVIVQDYKSEAGVRLSLEVFEMRSPASAYGMFTFKRSPRGLALDLGDEGQLADYYLYFCKGRFLVTITALDPEESANSEILAVARAVNLRLNEAGTRPGLVSILTEEDLLEPSVKFYRGPLGVSNSEPLLAGLAAGIKNGVKGDYVSGGTVFVLEYPDAESSEEKMAQAKDIFSDLRGFDRFGVSGRVLSSRDPKGRSIFARLEGNFLAFVIGDIDRDEACALLDRVTVRLKTLPKVP